MAKTTLKFFTEHKFEAITITAIVVLALFFRLYRIDEYLTFLGDEGRDVRIVRDLMRGNLVFIGPQTSIGNMYLGPLYYYMMVPFLWLSHLDPVGPAIMVAMIGTFTVFLVWYIGRRWFNPMTGLLAALFMAISPVAIIYSRSSWNPNPMPLFALLTVWFTHQFWQTKNPKLLPTVSLLFSICLQFHYLGLLLLPTILVFYVLVFRSTTKKNQLFKYTATAILVFVISLFPLILFDIKHQGMNFLAFKQFFSNRQTTININPANSNRFIPVGTQMISDILLGQNSQYAPYFALFIVLVLLFYYRQFQSKPALITLSAWIFFAVLGLGIYKQHVYAHYFGFVQPAIFLLIAISLSMLYYQSFVGKIVTPLVFLFLIFQSYLHSPLNLSPNHQLQRTKAIADLIIQNSNNEPFNFGLIAKQNYDESYRYFLENNQAKIVRGEDGVVSQLFVVCEDGDKCQPLGNPQWQIAVFGIAAIEEQWNVDGIKIYKLVHPHASK